ncbi:hypothetical protein [Undibacterium flavidum]|uniref:YiaAB two helix domain-containing protein n=1 Tax=Undibacterium flavidum TaxID=2762297 RepID=A0ABR6Y7K2_9BURK|nr:hypothetical protein [Undibacterium flavidum]MBC3872583.1 hypothetical protein [Undibacterium flavidum]
MNETLSPNLKEIEGRRALKKHALYMAAKTPISRWPESLALSCAPIFLALLFDKDIATSNSLRTIAVVTFLVYVSCTAYSIRRLNEKVQAMSEFINSQQSCDSPMLLDPPTAQDKRH